MMRIAILFTIYGLNSFLRNDNETFILSLQLLWIIRKILSCHHLPQYIDIHGLPPTHPVIVFIILNRD